MPSARTDIALLAALQIQTLQPSVGEHLARGQTTHFTGKTIRCIGGNAAAETAANAGTNPISHIPCDEGELAANVHRESDGPAQQFQPGLKRRPTRQRGVTAASAPARASRATAT